MDLYIICTCSISNELLITSIALTKRLSRLKTNKSFLLSLRIRWSFSLLVGHVRWSLEHNRRLTLFFTLTNLFVKQIILALVVALKMTSYKEAQERLLKWCQNVTRNYEVRRIAVSRRRSQASDLVRENSEFDQRFCRRVSILCDRSSSFSRGIRFQRIESRAETTQLWFGFSDCRVSHFCSIQIVAQHLHLEKKLKSIHYLIAMIWFTAHWTRNASSPIS